MSTETTYAQRFAFCMQRFRSIAREIHGDEDYELLFGNDYMVGDESMIRFQEIADSGEEMSYQMLFNLRYLATMIPYNGLRAVIAFSNLLERDPHLLDKKIKQAMIAMQVVTHDIL
jgi:hypothetical protein